MNTHIVINHGSFRPGGVGPSTGEIWLTIDGVAFPAPHWNDFVIVILEAWAAALLRLARGYSRFERVHFMDGPYEVELSRTGEGVLELRALERGSVEKARVSVRVDPLLADLLAAAEAMVLACHRHGDTSNDAVRLERALPIIRTEVTNSKN